MKTIAKKRPSIRMHLLEVSSAIALISSILYGVIFLLAIGILNHRYMNTETDYFLQRMTENMQEIYTKDYLTGEIEFAPGDRQRMENAMENYESSFWIIYDREGQFLDTFGDNIHFDEYEPEYSFQPLPYTMLFQGIEYRINRQYLGSNTWLVIGIPQSHGVKALVTSLDRYVLLVLLLPIVVVLGFYLFTFKITKPLEEIRKKMKNVQEGDFETKLPEYHEREFYEISEGFNSMTSGIKSLFKEVYEKQLLIKEQELRFWQSQMNPHFIFNVLNSIALKAKMENNEELSHTISAFSQLIQAKIYRSDREEIQIKQELEYVNYYLEIQKFRFEEKISYSIQIEDELLDQYIPKLCIQPLVENAVIHGLEPMEGNGSVIIRGFRRGSDMIIEVADDGAGFDCTGEILLPLENADSNSSHNSVGLNNVHSILQLRYGSKYGLRIFSGKGKGTTVSLSMPFAL